MPEQKSQTQSREFILELFRQGIEGGNLSPEISRLTGRDRLRAAKAYHRAWREISQETMVLKEVNQAPLVTLTGSTVAELQSAATREHSLNLVSRSIKAATKRSQRMHQYRFNARDGEIKCDGETLKCENCGADFSVSDPRAGKSGNPEIGVPYRAITCTSACLMALYKKTVERCEAWNGELKKSPSEAAPWFKAEAAERGYGWLGDAWGIVDANAFLAYHGPIHGDKDAMTKWANDVADKNKREIERRLAESSPR